VTGNWLIRLLRWLISGSEQSLSLPQPVAPAQPPLATVLEGYQQALDALHDDPQALLPTLVARDQVEVAQQQVRSPSTEQVKLLTALDEQLCKQVASLALDALPTWRRTLRPPDAHWWWFLDQEAQKREEEKDLPWVLLTGTFVVFTLPLATDIIKRLWDGAPDTLSVLGTVLTLLLTGSPFTQRGRDLVQWILKRIPRLRPRFRAEAMAAMAALAFVLVLGGRLVLLPQLAVYYNERGLDALLEGNLTATQRSFQRAVALDAGMAVGYYHLANVYEEIARPTDAITWYQRAIDHDLNLSAAYNNLGRLYILGGRPELAVQVFQAGLKRTTGATETDRITRYRLLSNLGWAYQALDEPERAHTVLEEAIALESEIPVGLRSAVPHYYLALAYQALGMPEAALVQFEDSLRYLDSTAPEQGSWGETIHQQLEQLRQEVP